MAKSEPKMQSWQILHYARKHLGRSILYAIFGKKNARAVDYWCENPRFTSKDEKAYDPVQGVKDLLDILDDHGHAPVVRAAIGFLSAGTSAEVEGDQAIVDLLPSIGDEILADYRAVAAMQRAIEAGEDINIVEALKQDALTEIERTFARYRKDFSIPEGG